MLLPRNNMKKEEASNYKIGTSFFYNHLKQISTILFFIINLTLTNVFAQINLHVQIGANSNSITPLNNTEVLTEASNKIGGFLSIGIDVPIKKENIYLSSAVSFIQKSYTIKRTGYLSGIYESHNNNYIQTPLLLKYKITGIKKFDFYLTGGFYIAFWVTGKEKGKNLNVYESIDSVNSYNNQVTSTISLSPYDVNYQFNNTKDNRIEVGLNYGTEVHYKFSKQIIFECGIDYYNSLSDQQKKYMINQPQKYNQTILFSMGVIFKTVKK